MKFWLETCEDIDRRALGAQKRAKFVEVALPGQAAKMFAEMGARGRSVIRDEDGRRTTWTLHAAVIHYAYQVE